MNFRNFKNITSLILLILLSSCGVSKKLNIDKNAPDEYLVVKQPPLVVPSNFKLVKPIDNSQTQVAPVTEKEVDNILFAGQNAKKTKKTNLSKSDRQFIKASDKHKKQQNIKDLIKNDKKKKKKKSLFS